MDNVPFTLSSLFNMMDWCGIHITAATAPSCQSPIALSLTHEQALEILKLLYSTWSSNSSPTLSSLNFAEINNLGGDDWFFFIAHHYCWALLHGQMLASYFFFHKTSTYQLQTLRRCLVQVRRDLSKCIVRVRSCQDSWGPTLTLPGLEGCWTQVCLHWHSWIWLSTLIQRD